MRFLPSWTNTSPIVLDPVAPGVGFVGVPGTARLKTSVGSCATPKIEMTRAPVAATAGGTCFNLNLLPSMRAVKAVKACSGFEPSGSTTVKKATVSLSMNRG
jgi:hypothetical protein